jgi:hypothetical protein
MEGIKNTEGERKFNYHGRAITIMDLLSHPLPYYSLFAVYNEWEHC